MYSENTVVPSHISNHIFSPLDLCNMELLHPSRVQM